MAHSRSAMKRQRTSEKERLRNKARGSAIKTTEKKLRTVLATGQVDQAQACAQEAITKIDKAVKAGTVHRNKSARKKAQFSKLLAKVAAPSA